MITSHYIQFSAFPRRWTVRRKGGWEATFRRENMRCGVDTLATWTQCSCALLASRNRNEASPWTLHLVLILTLKSCLVWVLCSIQFTLVQKTTNKTNLLCGQRVHTKHIFSPASEMSRSTSWSCPVQVKEHLYLQALSCIPFQFLRRDSTSRTCSSSEGRMERWQNSRNTNHLLLDSELVKTKPIFLFCYFLFLTFRMTQLGLVCTVLNLMNTVYRWRHKALFFVCLFWMYFI